MLKRLDKVSIAEVRQVIVKASETIENLKTQARQQVLPPLYGVGGTALGGYNTNLPPVMSPYLP